MSANQLFLIDAHALCYRSFYAIKGLATSQGQATNAVYGFVATLRKILRDYQPNFVAICFDSPKKTHRQEKFAQYKIQRPSMPEDLISQIPIIKRIIKAYNLNIFECDGFEADDIIATLCSLVSKKNIDVVIVSDDKDMYQLANNKVRILNYRDNTFLGHEELNKKLGFEPHRIIDFIALAGDKSDNIPGVSGIGEVTAKHLINEFGTLEDIYHHVERIQPVKVKEKLMAQKKMAQLSKELAILERKVPIPYEMKSMKVQLPDNKKLFEIFRELEFKKLAEEFTQAGGGTTSRLIFNISKPRKTSRMLLS